MLFKPTYVAFILLSTVSLLVTAPKPPNRSLTIPHAATSVVPIPPPKPTPSDPVRPSTKAIKLLCDMAYRNDNYISVLTNHPMTCSTYCFSPYVDPVLGRNDNSIINLNCFPLSLGTVNYCSEVFAEFSDFTIANNCVLECYDLINEILVLMVC